jgi:putative thiamine transport system ATP-binding protein
VSHRLILGGVSIAIDDVPLLTVDADIGPGEVLTVTGKSGSGKSTLLAYLAGFIDPVFSARGRVLLDGVDITERPAETRRIGLLFQDALLFPHLSVIGNLMFGMVPGRGRPDRAAAALADAGLAGFEDRDPGTLSGGQQARVALLRLLLSDPHAVLLDEPFSKLDAHLRGEIRALVFDRLRVAGLPAVLVTHDVADVATAKGQVLNLDT